MKYDLIIIGGGSGGVACARRSSALGAKVALIEADRLGGTCVIRGCVPKKLLMYASGFKDVFNDAQFYGWQSENYLNFDMEKWQNNKTYEIQRLEKIYTKLLADSGVDVLKGHATIVNPKTVNVNGNKINSQKIMVATGGIPTSHPIPGLNKCMTSNEILELKHLPEKLAVLGSGYISLEFASIFKKLGSDVSIFFRSDFPLRGFDLDIRKRISANFNELGIKLHPMSQIQAIEKHKDYFTLETNTVSENFSEILNGLGRTPNSKNLKLEESGVNLGNNGEILVNDYSQTSQDGIFAIGDVTNRMNLTPVAIAEGRAFAENEFNNKNLLINYDSIASAVFTSPSIGSIGLTENQAIKLNSNQGVKIYESEFKPMRQTFTHSKIRTYMKLIVDSQTDIILGIHLIGPEAPELIQVLAIPFRMKATKSDFDNTIAVHPTSAEELVLMRSLSRSYPTRKSI